MCPNRTNWKLDLNSVLFLAYESWIVLNYPEGLDDHKAVCGSKDFRGHKAEKTVLNFCSWDSLIEK